MTPAELEHDIRAALATIGELHDATFDPDLPKVRGGGGGKPGSRAPLPIGGLSARCHVQDLLTDLRKLIEDESDRWPVVSWGETEDTPALAQWLVGHARWLAQHPLAAESAENGGVLARLQYAAGLYRQVTTPPPGRWVKVGPCPVTTEGPCSGTVHAWLPTDDVNGDGGDCACDVDTEHSWTRSQWSLLARLQGDDAPSHLVPADLARWLTARLGARGITHRHVGRWVTRYPEVAALRDDDGRLDRTAFALWWLERREQVAA